MKHLACAILLALIALPSLAEAKYRMLPPEQVLAQAEHVVVASVSKVTSSTFTLEVERSLDTELPAQIQVTRRLPGRCKPMDPQGIRVGSRLLWCLRGKANAQRLGSWVGSPYWIRDGRLPQLSAWLPRKGVERQAAPTRGLGPRLTHVLQAVRGFRARVSYVRYRLHRRCSPAELITFQATGPLAAYLVVRSGSLQAPPLPTPTEQGR